MNLDQYPDAQRHWKKVLAQPESASRHQRIPRLGPSRIPRQRDRNAGRQFTPYSVEADGRVLRPSRSRSLRPSRRTHLPQLRRHRSRQLSPGEPFHFATVMSIGGHVTGLLVETHDGRPTKIEGNPDHPHSLGAATAIQQAIVLGMYDPDRSAKVLQGGKESTWPALEAAVQKLSLGDGSGLRFLSGFVSSPTLDSQRTAILKKFPKAKWVEYEALSRDNELAGANMAFGQPLYAHPKWDKAKVVVSLDHDFLNLDAPTPFLHAGVLETPPRRIRRRSRQNESLVRRRESILTHWRQRGSPATYEGFGCPTVRDRPSRSLGCHARPERSQ